MSGLREGQQRGQRREAALNAGQRPGGDGWGEDPPGRWGTIGAEGAAHWLEGDPITDVLPMSGTLDR